MVAPGIMPLGGAQAAAGPPLTNLTWQMDPSDASKVFQTKLNANPSWSTAGADGVEAAVVVSTVPGAGIERPLETFFPQTTQAPLWKVTGSALALPSLLFDGSNDQMLWWERDGASNFLLSEAMGAGAKTLLTAFSLPQVINGSPTGLWDNPVIYGDSVGKFGLHMYDAGGGTYKVYAYNNQGSPQYVELPVLLNTRYVACVRHNGTNLYLSLNGGTEVSIASGNTPDMSGRMHFGQSFGRFDKFSLGEMLVYDVALTGADLTAAIDYMVNKWV